MGRRAYVKQDCYAKLSRKCLAQGTWIRATKGYNSVDPLCTHVHNEVVVSVLWKPVTFHAFACT